MNVHVKNSDGKAKIDILTDQNNTYSRPPELYDFHNSGNTEQDAEKGVYIMATIGRNKAVADLWQVYLISRLKSDCKHHSGGG